MTTIIKKYDKQHIACIKQKYYLAQLNYDENHKTT